MQVYDLKDSPYDVGSVNQNDYYFLVTDYEEGYYDGNGEAIAFGKDGKLYFSNLGHCSCYGPLDEFPNGGSLSVEEFIEQGSSVLDETSDPLRSKVLSLLENLDYENIIGI